MVELQTEGKIKHLALTNFDTEHLQIINAAGINIVSNLVVFISEPLGSGLFKYFSDNKPPQTVP
ncbi:MAG: aldo/keto reductase [Dolichospermum sp.]